MIRLAGVRFSYTGAAVLDGADLEVRPGEGVALLGANGAGKTTLLRLCMALLHPDAGTVEVAGRATTRLAPEDLAGEVGYLFQRPEDQLVRSTVREEVAFGPELLGWERARIIEAVPRILDVLQLAGDAERHPYDLPLPRRRLVALASVLVTEPRVLLLDEPTALLDRAARALVARIVRARAAAGVAVLAVTHDPVFAIEALHRAVALHDGRVAADAPVSELLGRGVAGLTLPPHVRAAHAAGIRGVSDRMEDLAEALVGRVGTAGG
ncbi:MAG TPA: ABC transporter ATP-binding protein [Gemmatimonadales bacterium]|nr:ABC transporter ATP-binding protein [Gemmatimonadales bacterium]